MFKISLHSYRFPGLHPIHPACTVSSWELLLNEYIHNQLSDARLLAAST